MAHSVFDRRRGIFSVRWNDGKKLTSMPVTTRPPRGWKPGDPRPKDPPIVLEAKAEKTRLEQAIRSGGRISLPVRVFLDARRELCLARGSKTSERAFKVFDHFASFCGDLTVDQVTPNVCEAWFNSRSKEISRKTKKPRAYNALSRDKSLLQGAWTRAVKLGQLDRNPWTAIEVPAKPTESKRESWSPEQLEKLLAVSRPWLRDLLIVGCNTGLRISALLAIGWKDIRFGEPGLGLLKVPKALDKGGKGYSVPLSRRCFDTLMSMPRTAATVVTGMKGRSLVCPDTVAVAIERACARAGLPEPSSPNHHMRRTFGRQAVLGQLTGRPVPIFVVSKWLGHASVEQTEYYLDMKESESHQWMEDHASLGQRPVETNKSQ